MVTVRYLSGLAPANSHCVGCAVSRLESAHERGAMQSLIRWLCLTFLFAVSLLVPARDPAWAQSPDRPWMNSALAPEERAELVLKQMTLEEKLALLHGNGMAHEPQWRMPLTHLANGAPDTSRA